MVVLVVLLYSKMVLLPIILLLFLTVSGTSARGEACPHHQNKNGTNEKYHLRALNAGQNTTGIQLYQM